MTSQEGSSVPNHDDSLEPSPAEMGDTTTLAPGEWTPLDEIGTQLYVYGDQPVDIAIQYAEVEDELRQLRREVDVARELIGTVRAIAETWSTDPGAYPDGAADPLEQIANVLLGPRDQRRGVTRPNPVPCWRCGDQPEDHVAGGRCDGCAGCEGYVEGDPAFQATPTSAPNPPAVKHEMNIESGSWLCSCGTWYCPESVPATNRRPPACPLHGAVLDCPDTCEGRTNTGSNPGGAS